MLSIVIPAYNEEKTIEQCLAALVKQKTDKELEVILVDNNSSDNTAEIAKTFSKRLNIRMVKELKKGRGAARARGFKEAKGEVILSTDADTVVPPDWIEGLTGFFASPKVIAVTGTTKVRDSKLLTNIAMSILQPLFMHLYRIYIGHYWLSGFNFAIRKDIYEESGGFDDNLNTLEDVDLSVKVAKLGRIVFTARYPVQTSGRRYSQGLIPGLLDYLSTYKKYRKGSNKSVTMSDVR